MATVISALLFAIFAVFSAIAGWLRNKRYLRWFLAFAAVAITGPGFVHKEAWPFSRWQLFAYQYRPPLEVIQMSGVDAAETEFNIDRRAWEPFSGLDLHTWIQMQWKTLPAQEQDVAARYLLELVNHARENALARRTVGVYGRYFGRFAAPLHVVHQPIWTDPTTTPPRLVRLRIYLHAWDVEERDRDPRAWHRQLIYEGPK